MKKTLGVFAFILLIAGAIVFYRGFESPLNEAVFASQPNMNAQQLEALVKRLEANQIPYQIDMDGNVQIPEKLVKKAIICCT